MIKLFSIRDQKQQEEKTGVKKIQSAQLRVQKDMSKLELPGTCKIEFPNGPDDIMNFNITISPEEGYYKGASFVFSFAIPPEYPHVAPKVLCTTKIFHPNIDWEGKICLNILREDWKPILDIGSVVYGLNFLMMDPNPEDPLNKEAAEIMKQDLAKFEDYVNRSLRGQRVLNRDFDRLIK
eukprot:c5873_g1_i1.p1 GENE.c5873_g1_i1~~c5873_g1_i1.p1  ORF type:complete len:180 (+),score=34.30 c5873_g1_i1:35-574(+)